MDRKKRVLIKGGIAVLAIGLLLAVLAFVFLRLAENERKAKEERAIAEKAAEEAKKLQIRREENAKALLEQLYVSYLPEDVSIPAANRNEKTFSEWFFEDYGSEPLLTAAEDGELTAAEMYALTGESLHVLLDRYHGLLKDAETATQHHIYIRDGKTEKEAEIAIAGDLCFAEDGFVLDYYDTVNDLTKCISPEILEITNQADLFYVNHEYCISDRGAPLPGKYYTFRAKPARMELLKQMGTDLVSLANNHVYDYGRDAMLDTADLLESAGIPYVGGGRNIEEAKRPVYFVVNGIKIGFVGACNGEKIRYTPQATEDSPGILRAYDTTEYNEVIRKASKECDYLIAYIHWGTEDTNYYNADQQRWGREFLHSGADIVVGGHPHVLQGMEYVDGKPVIYSLGDFWFNHETKYTGLLKLRVGIEGLKEMSFVPCLQTNDTTQYLSTAEKQRELYDFLENLSPNIAIDEEGVITER